MVLQGDFIPSRDMTTKNWLCIKFLRGPTSLRIKRSKASNKTRWMTKLHVLYAFKICLLEPAVNELPPDTIASKQQIFLLRRFIIFSALIYCPWWFTCIYAIDVPHHDLEILKRLLRLGRLYHQMLSAVVSSQSTVSSSRAAKPRWYGDRKLVSDRPFAPLLCICSLPRAPSSIFCIVERKNSTPVRRWFSLTQEGLDKVIPGGEGPGDGINVVSKSAKKHLIGTSDIFFPEMIGYYLCLVIWFQTQKRKRLQKLYYYWSQKSQLSRHQLKLAQYLENHVFQPMLIKTLPWMT